MDRSPKVALVTYSTKPRGGVVHTLALAETLHGLGAPVHIFAIGGEHGEGFFRETAVPHTLVAPPVWAAELEDRVERSVRALVEGMRGAASVGRFDLLHVEDCIAARAAGRLREEGARFVTVRTVHHVDDFTTPALVECQRRSIVDPDLVLVVSEHWRRLLARDFGVAARVITNGVDGIRFARPAKFDGGRFRERAGTAGCFLFLTVGGLEPRKGSLELVEALAGVRQAAGALGLAAPVLAVIGNHAFQDHSAYRERTLARVSELGLELGRDLLLPGCVADAELPAWYWSADAFCFPSVKEGWGLALMEAMAAGLPAIVSDIPVFREFLSPGRDVRMFPAGDARALGAAMLELMTDPGERRRLARRGPAVAARFTWERCARRHLEIYAEATGRIPLPPTIPDGRRALSGG